MSDTSTLRSDTQSVNGDVNEDTANPQQNLIAELKASKDILGIRKLKEEKAIEKQQVEKQQHQELNKQYTTENFVELVPAKDLNGLPIPDWKRQMLAKRAAEKAKKEAEENRIKELEAKRLESIPAWKRQLLQRKEKDKDKSKIFTPKVEEKKPSMQTEFKPLNEVIEEINKSNEETPNQHRSNSDSPSEESQQENVMPWRGLLRKTNSKLSLLE